MNGSQTLMRANGINQPSAKGRPTVSKRARSALIVIVGNRQCRSSPVIWPGFEGTLDFPAVR